MYFRLNPECYYIEGERCGAIYDLIEGNIYALNAQESQIIKKCEQDRVVEESNGFLRNLKNLGIGNFYDQKVYLEKIRIGSPIEEYQPCRPPTITKAFLEINNSCDQSCWFCGSNGISRSMGCIGCNHWSEEGEELSLDRWKRIVDELEKLDCSSIYLIGGDLTKTWDRTLEIVDYAGVSLKDVFITIHSRNFTEDIANDVKDKARLIIQTEKPADIVDDHYYLLTLRHDELDKIKEIRRNNVMIDIIIDGSKIVPPESPLISKKKIQKVDIYRYSHTKKHHPCLGNSLTISWRGEVLPCPLLRDYSLGNIRDAALYTIFTKNHEKIERFWNMNLETLPKCRRCEFRYACTDCRALEKAMTGDLYGKTLCTYDPEKGIWL